MLCWVLYIFDYQSKNLNGLSLTRLWVKERNTGLLRLLTLEKGELHTFQNRNKKFIISFISCAGTLLEKEMVQDFGTSTRFLEYAAYALKGKTTRIDNLCKSFDLEISLCIIENNF